jgi:hypothetical protein
MKAHFIEIDLLIKTESKPWIVDKNSPNIPLLKMETHDFNLFKSGVYKYQGNKLSFNGKQFWISNEFMNKIKVKCKNKKIDISNLAISLQEFLNKELIENIPFEIDLNIFKRIVNTNEDIYIICSKNKKQNFENQIKKLESNLEEIGLKVKKYYFISETFSNKDEDEIAYNKIKLILQHLIGLKSDGNKLSSNSIEHYDKIYFYDDNKKTIDLSKKINDVLEKLLLLTDDSIKTLVKDRVKNNDNLLIINEYTHNKANKFNEFLVQLEYSNLIKSFENFNSSSF